MKMERRNEVHICLADSGHRDSTDCWCEPNKMYWYTNAKGILMFVVEHNDDVHIHRIVRVAARERDKNLAPSPDVLWGIDAPWITRALDITYGTGPVEPNERNL
jgi:hypothetical protein